MTRGSADDGQYPEGDDQRHDDFACEWVLELLLDTPSTMPTVEIEALDPDIRGETTIQTISDSRYARPMTPDSRSFSIASQARNIGYRQRSQIRI